MSEVPFKLGEKSEAAWADLSRHIEWAEGFWIAFLFTPSVVSADSLRERTGALLRYRQQPLRTHTPDAPQSLSALLPELLVRTDEPVPLTWIQAVRMDHPLKGTDEKPWARAWESFLLRANERRELLRDRFTSGLIMVAPEELKSLFREAAPDLWSVRTMVLELDSPLYEPSDDDTPRVDIEPPPDHAAGDPELALQEAARLQRSRPHAHLAIAQALVRAAEGLLSNGRIDEARDSVAKARRHLQAVDPSTAPESPAVETQQASTLLKLGKLFSQLVEPVHALDATQQAVVIYRNLSTRQPDNFLPTLAGALNNLGNRYSDLGQREEALASALESAEIYRKLATTRPDAFLSDLAMSLNNLGTMHSDLGQREEALVTTLEAVDIYRKLAAIRPDAFLSDLAMSLNNLGTMLSYLGQREEALTSTREAVEVYRKLAATRPDESLSGLAGALNNLGAMHSYLGQREEALGGAREAVEIYRKLAATRPDSFLPGLAGALNNLGNRYSDLGQREEALGCAREAVEIYRKLAATRPDSFLPDLAMSLNNLGAMLSYLGQREEALTSTREAVEIRRRLAATRPDAFGPDLAMSLNNLGNRYSELGQREEAFDAAEEAVRILTPLFMRLPTAFAKWMAIMARNYRSCAEAAGREVDDDLLNPVLAALNAGSSEDK